MCSQRVAILCTVRFRTSQCGSKRAENTLTLSTRFPHNIFEIVGSLFAQATVLSSRCERVSVILRLCSSSVRPRIDMTQSACRVTLNGFAPNCEEVLNLHGFRLQACAISVGHPFAKFARVCMCIAQRSRLVAFFVGHFLKRLSDPSKGKAGIICLFVVGVH